ncbi:hypothetical protein RHSIM_Rhsim07G0114000 [Rhododendron simsii]|uniref:CCHC-type domain-containing protein n=1 Tax=Rhododendron simsii TaxID=118357 RepID=A0A834GNP6_RHOSS|nr:hypothetical protein RHSIM_Rhsim07G0114000 [Rhododendron simsii]
MENIEVLDLEEGSGETGEITNLCLLGKVLSPKPLNITAISNICNTTWKTRTPFSIVPWSNNVFLFRFQDAEDKASIIRDSPWSVNNSLLVLQNLINGVAIPDQIFTHSPFWVQIHGLPIEKMTQRNAEIIGKRFSKLLAIESSVDGLLLGRSFLRVKVEIEISKPLPKGFWLRKNTEAGKDLWISYKYEKLSDFCYDCGRLGHDKRSCKFVSREEGSNSGYNAELRASWVRRSQIPVIEFNYHGERAEGEANLVVGRQPETSNAEGETRGKDVLSKRVVPRANQQQQHSAEGAHTPRPQDTSVALERTAVLTPIETGIIPRTPLLDASVTIEPLSSKRSPPLSIDSLTVCPNLTSQITHTYDNPYFVTEPPDSPKSPRPKPSTPTFPLIQPKGLNSNPPSPDHTYSDSPPLSPKTFSHTNLMDISLSTVFTSLNLKRKVVDPIDEERDSKLLRLCAPEPKPNPINLNTKSSLPKINHKQKRAYTKRALNAKHYFDNFGEAALCDVPIGVGSSDGVKLDDVSIEGVYPNLAMDKGHALGDLVRRNRPSIIFLMETKNNKAKMEPIRRRLHFDFSFYVEPEGLAGGIALWWNNDISIDVEFAHRNLVHTAISTSVDSSRWAATFVYGCPTHAGKEKVWNELRKIADMEQLPWMCVGDFNQVLSVGDNIGGNLPDPGRIMAFNDMLNECGLVDLGCKGPRFTWRNNRSEGGFIMERIDMAFANMDWRERFDTALVFVEVAVGSDHNPLLINTNFSLNKIQRPFRFESLWTTEDECHCIIAKAWNHTFVGSEMFQLCKKLRGCKDDLKVWHRNNFDDLRFQIAILRDQLVGIQKENEVRFNADNYVKEKVMITKLEDLWQKEAMFWHQRSRVNWLKMGDKNTRFFHLSTIHRRQRNQVAKLKDEYGNWHVDKECIAGVIKGHFEKLYSPPQSRDIEDIISLIDPVVHSEMNTALTKAGLHLLSSFLGPYPPLSRYVSVFFAMGFSNSFDGPTKHKRNGSSITSF